MLQQQPADLIAAVLAHHDAPLAYKLQTYPAHMHVHACCSCSTGSRGAATLVVDVSRPAVVQAAAAALSRVNVLERLCLTGTIVHSAAHSAEAQWAGVHDLVRALVATPRLRSLELSGPHTCGAAAAVGRQGHEALFVATGALTALTHVRVAMRLLRGAPLLHLSTLHSLQHLDLADALPSSVHVAALLAACTALTRLHLWPLFDNPHDAALVRRVADRAATLRHLDLAYADTTPGCGELEEGMVAEGCAIAARDASALACLAGLTNLVLRQALVPALQLGVGFAGLRALQVECCLVGGAAAEQLAAAIGGMTQLTALEVRARCCDLDPEGHAEGACLSRPSFGLCELLTPDLLRCQALQRVCVCARLDAHGAAVAAGALAALPALRALYLGTLEPAEHSPEGYAAVRPPGQAVGDGGRVLSLSFAYGAEQLAALAPALAVWGGLAQLRTTCSADDRHRGTDKTSAVRQLLAACPRLVRLYAEACTLDVQPPPGSEPPAPQPRAAAFSLPRAAVLPAALPQCLRGLTSLQCDFFWLEGVHAAPPVGGAAALRHLELLCMKLAVGAATQLAAEVVQLRQLTHLLLNHDNYVTELSAGSEDYHTLRWPEVPGECSPGVMVAEGEEFMLALAAQPRALPSSLRSLDLSTFRVAARDGAAAAAVLTGLQLTALRLWVCDDMSDRDLFLLYDALAELSGLECLGLTQGMTLTREDVVAHLAEALSGLLCMRQLTLVGCWPVVAGGRCEDGGLTQEGFKAELAARQKVEGTVSQALAGVVVSVHPWFAQREFAPRQFENAETYYV